MIICEGICFFAGLYFLFTGRVKWGRKTIRGEKARLMGFLLLVPIPVAFIAALLLTPSAQTDEEVFQAILTASSIEFIAIIIVLVTVIYIFIKTPETGEVVVGAPVQQTVTYSGGGFGAQSGILTVPEAANYLRVSEAEILNMIDTGRLAAAKIGTEYRISKSVIDDMLKNR